MLDYERLTVRDLKRIVNRGEATPAAIGLFVLSDIWEREHGRRTIVDNKLLRYIEGKWAFTAYANELDFWQDLAVQLKSLSYFVKETKDSISINRLKIKVLISRTALSFIASRQRQLHELINSHGVETVHVVMSVEELEEIDRAIKDLPREEELEEQQLDIYASVSILLGLYSVIEPLGTLLGVPFAEGIETEIEALTSWTKEYEADIDSLERAGYIPPDMVKSLKRLTRIDFIQPSSAAVDMVEERIGAYLSSNWRTWAAAGVRLREIADSSKSIVDLLRHAEIAAAELDHE